MTSIALLCPTRGREQQFKRMCESVAVTTYATNTVNIYSASNGGDAYAKYQFPIDCPTVHMWNGLAIEAMKNPDHKLFMLCADDVVFSTPLWDEALIRHYEALENKVHVYALQDSRDAQGTPHPIVTREWIEGLGYFMPPFFTHWFVDTWTVQMAKVNGVFTHMKDYLLIHDKPSDVGKPDETHTRIRMNGWHERDKYVNETCQHVLHGETERLAKAMAERYK